MADEQSYDEFELDRSSTTSSSNDDVDDADDGLDDLFADPSFRAATDRATARAEESVAAALPDTLDAVGESDVPADESDAADSDESSSGTTTDTAAPLTGQDGADQDVPPGQRITEDGGGVPVGPEAQFAAPASEPGVVTDNAPAGQPAAPTRSNSPANNPQRPPFAPRPGEQPAKPAPPQRPPFTPPGGAAPDASKRPGQQQPPRPKSRTDRPRTAADAVSSGDPKADRDRRRAAAAGAAAASAAGGSNDDKDLAAGLGSDLSDLKNADSMAARQQAARDAAEKAARLVANKKTGGASEKVLKSKPGALALRVVRRLAALQAALPLVFLAFAVLVGAALVVAVTEDDGFTSSFPYTLEEGSPMAINDTYLAAYQQAGRNHGIPWTIIAGVGQATTEHGRYAPSDIADYGMLVDRAPYLAPIGSAPGSRAPSKASPPPGSQVTVVGDSFVDGVKASFSKLLDVYDVSYVGRSGVGIAGVRDDVLGAYAQGTQVVVVQAGVNDIVNNAAESTYRASITELLDAASGRTACVVWVNLQVFYDKRYAKFGPAAQRFNVVLAEEAAARPWVKVVDLAAVTAVAGMQAPDGLHLSPTGYRAWSEATARTVLGCGATSAATVSPPPTLAPGTKQGSAESTVNVSKAPTAAQLATAGASVVRLAGVARCTGALLDATTVLTAAHCIDTETDTQVEQSTPGVISQSNEILVEYNDMRYKVDRIVTLPGYSSTDPLDSTTDVAAVILQQPIQATFATVADMSIVPWAWAAFSYQSTVINEKYPDVKRWDLRTCQPSKVTDLHHIRWKATCGLQKGGSGGPLFAIENGKLEIVGVLSTISSADVNTWSGLPAIHALLDEVDRVTGRTTATGTINPASAGATAPGKPTAPPASRTTASGQQVLTDRSYGTLVCVAAVCGPYPRMGESKGQPVGPLQLERDFVEQVADDRSPDDIVEAADMLAEELARIRDEVLDDDITGWYAGWETDPAVAREFWAYVLDLAPVAFPALQSPADDACAAGPLAGPQGAVLQWPVAGPVALAEFGAIDGSTQSTGMVLTGDAGTALAAGAGTVSALGTDELGTFVSIAHGDGFVSKYRGLAAASVAVDQPVEQGVPVGTFTASVWFETWVGPSPRNPRLFIADASAVSTADAVATDPQAGTPVDDPQAGVPLDPCTGLRIGTTATASSVAVPNSSSSVAALVIPVVGILPSQLQDSFGDPRSGGTRKHEGIDISVPIGTPLVAVADAVVHNASAKGVPCPTTGDPGKNVTLKDASGNHFYYGHMDTIAVSDGQQLRAGQFIGTVGQSGNACSSGPHLHFSINEGTDRVVNPYPILSGARPLRLDDFGGAIGGASLAALKGSARLNGAAELVLGFASFYGGIVPSDPDAGRFPFGGPGGFGSVPTVGGVTGDELAASAPEIAAIIKSYFPPEQWDNAIRVAHCESRLNPKSVSAPGNNKNGTRDHGLFQFNDGGTLQGWLQTTGEDPTNLARALDPHWSARAAAMKVERDGNWGQWTCAHKDLLHIVSESPQERATGVIDYNWQESGPGDTSLRYGK